MLSIFPRLSNQFQFLPSPLSSFPHAPTRRLLLPLRLLMADASLSSSTAGDAPPAAPVPAADAPDAGVAAETPDPDVEFGFQRPEMGKDKLAGTVQFYERHVILCYKGPEAWASHVEAALPDRIPGLLAAAIKANKPNLKKPTKLTICEGEDGTGSSDGDVLIFPDLVRYKGLNDSNVENFVEEVLVKDTEWLPGSPEAMKGSYVFVCSHGSRDKRCGVCGPILIKRFREEIKSLGLDGQVFVSASSHVGGHKYAGNVIIFSSDPKGEVTGHWYGYVTPDDVPVLLQKHIGQGEIVDHLWRGQMGLSEEQQKKAIELRNMINGASGPKESLEATEKDGASCNPAPAGGCCQSNGGGFTCCQSDLSKERQDKSIPAEQSDKSSGKENGKESSAGSKKGHTKICSMPTWFETWERADTYAALAVVAAAASVFVAFRVYKNLN